MFCLSSDKPIQLLDDDFDEHLDAVYYPDPANEIIEKELLPPGRPGEDEMQERLAALRDEVKKAQIDWYIVPSEDEHQSEDVANSEKRREWISNFTGSAGTALIPAAGSDAKAILFVDSRYWQQGEEQVPKENWTVYRVGASGGSGRNDVAGGWVDYVLDELEGARVGIDPKLISYDQARSIESRLAGIATKFVAVKDNLVDKVHTPPARSLGQLKPYPVSLSGESTQSKLDRMREKLGKIARTENWLYLIPALPTITWLLNYRCTTDIPFCPVAFAYAALTPKSCIIFINKAKVRDEDILADWKEANVTIRPYGIDEVEKAVKEVGVQMSGDKGKFKIMAAREASWGLVKACEPVPVEIITCPIEAAKALKNEVEVQNFRNAYLRDGRAMVRWLVWMEQKLLKENKEIGEWAAAAVLTRFRKQEDMFAGLAYNDISATGPNAALAHYAPTRQTEVKIDIETPYVIDSGPQYLDATIDTTRTWFFGKNPTDDMKRAYTRVLQGHIAVAQQNFPRGADAGGMALMSKKFLWEDGLDYGHGLGHGVGNYSTVHENPVGFRPGFSFQPNHVTTIEPGFYLEGQFGMRIENVYLCKEVETKYQFQGKRYLGFECLTRVPIDVRMIDWSLTTKSEIRWVNAHNTMVQEALLPILDDDLDHDAREWLKRVCKPKIILPWTGA